MAITKANRKFYILLIAALLLVTVSGTSLISNLLEYQEGRQSAKWTPVEGIIKYQTVHLVNRDGGKNHYTLNVTYIYHVGDNAYSGSRIAYPDTLEVSEAQDSILKKYTPESNVTIYYDPQHVEKSTVIPSTSGWKYLIPFLFWSALLVIPLVFIVRLLAEHKKLTSTHLEIDSVIQ